MRDMSECLAVLAVAAWANNEEAKVSAFGALESYLSCGSTNDEAGISRLHALAQAYEDMKLDSALALSIKASIEERISRFVENPAPEENS